MRKSFSNSYLIKLENIFGLDLHYFLTGSFWAMTQQIIGVTCGLLVSYLFGHFVSKTVFGEYNLILSIVGMLTFLSLPGIDPALTHSISLGFDKSLIQSQKLKLKLSFLGLPVLLVFALYYFLQHKTIIAEGLVIASLFFPLLNSYTNYPAFLTAKRRFATLTILASLSSLFFLLLVGSGILIQPASTLLILSAYFIALTLPSILAFKFSRKFMNSKSKTDIDLPQYGSFLTILSVLPWISGNLGNVLLGNFIGVESLAVFAVSGRFLTAVQKNFTVFYKPVTAKLAAQSPAEHVKTLKTHSLKLLLIGGLLASLMWIATPFLITFFFTSKYTEAIFYGRIMGLALIPLPFTWAVEDILVYQKLKKAQLIDAVIPQIIKILLYFILIPKWQIGGLIFVFMLDRFTEPLIPLYYLLKSTRKK